MAPASLSPSLGRMPGSGTSRWLGTADPPSPVVVLASEPPASRGRSKPFLLPRASSGRGIEVWEGWGCCLNGALGPKVQGTGELGWGQFPSWRFGQVSCVPPVCVNLWPQMSPLCQRMRLSWVSVPSTTFQLSFNQYVFPVRSAAHCHPLPRPGPTGPAAWNALPSPFIYHSHPLQDALPQSLSSITAQCAL